MTLLRRFLVVQLLMLWQGGFLFYAVFVVPVGSEVLGGTFEQGRITRFVAQSMNWIGLAAIAVFAWDLSATPGNQRGKRWLWASWLALALSLIALFAIHPQMMEMVDFKSSTFEDRSQFRFWHGAYLSACTVQWVSGLAYAFMLLRSWRVADHQVSARA